MKDYNCPQCKKHVSGTSNQTRELHTRCYNRMLKSIDEVDDKLRKIEEYCNPYAKQMWAASILGIIHDCEFREVPSVMKEKTITIAFYGTNITEEKINRAFKDQRKSYSRWKFYARWSWLVIHINNAKKIRASRVVTRKTGEKNDIF